MINVKDLFKNINDCCGCMACVFVCPKKTLTIIESKDGFFYPKYDETSCINCKKCISICPSINYNKLKTSLIESYGATAKNKEILNKSQSGGLSFIFGKYILENHGIFYGAVLCEDLVTRHKRCDNIIELRKTQGSKYVQSQIDIEIYKQIEIDLNNNKTVMFSGTPCQCAAVKNMFGNYENLFLIDLVCHGVMAPKFAENYISEKSKKKKVNHIDYRTNKYVTWGSGKVVATLTYDDNTEECFDDYTKIFLKDIFLRKSCYECKYATIDRIADITIGDFWGVKLECPDLYDENGVSFAIVYSIKGKALFESIKNYVDFKKVDSKHITSHNPRLLNYIGYNKDRSDFLFFYNIFGIKGYYPYRIFHIIKRVFNLKYLINKLKK